MKINTRKWISLGILGLMVSICSVAEEISPGDLLASVEIDDLLQRKTEKIRPKKVHTTKISDEDHVGQSVVHLRVEPFKLDELMVLSEIKYQIARQLQISDDFRLFFSRPWDDVILRSPNWKIVMTAFPPKGLRSQFYVAFELWVDGKRLTNFQRSLRCELWIDAYVATQRIDRGTVLNDGLVDIRPVDSLSLFQSTVSIGTPLSSFVLRNGVRAGDPIFQRDLKERPLIEKNNLIDVVAEEGMMKVTLKAKALEDGVKGQIIRIRNLQSYSDIQAEVIGVNKAKVHF